MRATVHDSVDVNLSKLQEIEKDKGAWYAAVHEVTKSQIQLSDWKQHQPFYQPPLIPTPSAPDNHFSTICFYEF